MPSLIENARAILKSLSATEDRTDPRVGDAAPTDETADAAGKEAAAAQASQQPPVPEPPAGDGAGNDPNAEAGAAAQGAGAEGGAAAGGATPEFDDHGNHDFSADEIREFKKAFGLEDRPVAAAAGEKPKAADEDIQADLKKILDLLGSHGAAIDAIKSHLSELASSSKGHGEAIRETQKAIGEVTTHVEAVEKKVAIFPSAAPAETPRAVVKAMATPPVEPPAEVQVLSSQEMMALASSGKMTALEIARLNRENAAAHLALSTHSGN